MKLLLFVAILLALSTAQYVPPCECPEGEHWNIGNSNADPKVEPDCVANPITGEDDFVENCTVYLYNEADSGYQCSVCAAEFFLNANACNAYDVTDCAMSSAAGVCTVCKQHFLLDGAADPNTCTTISTEIPNCAVYSAQETCTSCIDGWTLADNSCVEEQIENCASYVANGSAIECQNCVTGYGLKDSDKTCVAKTTIENCQIQGYTAEGVSTCTTCNEGYFEATNLLTCIQITNVNNCSSYSDDGAASSCDDCDDGFYLHGGACVDDSTDSGTNIAKCIKYTSDGGAINCLECGTDSFVNASDDACTDVTGGSAVENCKVHTADNVCSVCLNTHYFVNDTTCTINPDSDSTVGYDANCILYVHNTDKANCSQCNTGYILDSAADPPTCLADVTVDDCAQYHVSSNTVKCQSCAETHQLKDDNTCVLIPTDAPLCDAYDFNSATGAFTCNQCVDDAFENQSAECAQCPGVETSEDDDDDNNDDDNDDDDDNKKDDDKKDDDEDKDKNNSASIVSVCMGLVSVALIAVL